MMILLVLPPFPNARADTTLPSCASGSSCQLQSIIIDDYSDCDPIR